MYYLIFLVFLHSISNLLHFLGFIFSGEYTEIILIIAGWFITYILILKTNKVQQRNNLKVKIYEDILLAKKELDISIIEIDVFFDKRQLPWFDMEMIEKHSTWSSFSRPTQKWLDHLRKILDKYNNFTKAQLKLENMVRVWKFSFPELDIATEIMFKEFESSSNNIHKTYSYLQNIFIAEQDWNKWNKDEIELEMDNARDNIYDTFICTIEDYMVLLYNDLMYPLFDKKEYREDFVGNKYFKNKFLTKKGFIQGQKPD